LYSYRFQQYSPTAHAPDERLADTEFHKREKRDVEQKAGYVLAGILLEFCKQNECILEIDGRSLKKWIDELNSGQRIFDHRAHVKILHIREN
jgi:hypothetical protein